LAQERKYLLSIGIKLPLAKPTMFFQQNHQISYFLRKE